MTLPESLPPPPLPDAQPAQELDLNAIRDQVRNGEGGPTRTLDEVLAEPGGFHSAHFVNPAHGEVDTGPSLAEIRAAWQRAKTASQRIVEDTPGDHPNANQSE